MSYSLRSPIRTNKGREATETERLVGKNYDCESINITRIVNVYLFIINSYTFKIVSFRLIEFPA